MNKATFMLGYQAFSKTKCLYILEILIGTRTKFSHYLTYPRRSTIFGMRRENPRAWRTRLRIHIVNEDNPAIAGRDLVGIGWFFDATNTQSNGYGD